MNMEEKIYSLMAQAEDMQTHAKKLQMGADEVIKRLPEGLRDAMGRVSRDTMRVHIQWLVLAALVVVTVICFGLTFGVKYQAAELEDLTAQARTMQATIDKLGDQYGKAQLSTCGGRPCVRVDESLRQYGETKKGEVYMVIYGY